MLPENYRGVTVTNKFSTILESIIKDRIEPELLPTQSKLRHEFIEKSSSLNTASIVSQTIEEYSNNKKELYIVTLDAQKAFDRVNHEF